MLNLKKQTLGRITQSRTALVLFAATIATIMAGGSATEASAKSYRHHHHHAHHHFHHAAASSGAPAWRDANAAITASAGSQIGRAHV